MSPTLLHGGWVNVRARGEVAHRQRTTHVALSEFFDSVIQPNMATVCCSTVPLYCCWRRMYCTTQHRGMTMPTPEEVQLV